MSGPSEVELMHCQDNIVDTNELMTVFSFFCCFSLINLDVALHLKQIKAFHFWPVTS